MTDCVVPVHDDDTRARGGPICEHCSALGRRAVTDLVEAWLCLCHALGKDSGAGMDSPVTTAITESSPPLKVHALDLASKIDDEMQRWEVHIYGLSPRRDPSVRVHEAAQRILRYWPAFMVTQGSPTVVAEMVSLRDRAWTLLRFTELVHQLPLPCPICDVRDLRRPNGQDWSRCHACGVFLSKQDYDVAVRLALEEVGCIR